MKRTESKDLGLFKYERFEFGSQRLGRKETFGWVRPRDQPPRSTVYYFHTGNTDDRMFLQMEFLQRLDQATQELLVDRGVQFALPNFGLNFLLSAQEDPKRAFQEYFYEEILPMAEEGARTTSETRFLSGASLGGHSVLVAFFKRPDLFKGFACTMGALLNFDFYSEEQLDRYVREAGITDEAAKGLKGIFHGCFDSYALYRAIDPMLLIEGADPARLQGKRILVETGTSDDFGFHAGMTDVAEALERKGIPRRFEKVKGGRHEPAFAMSRFSPMLRFLIGSEAERAAEAGQGG